MGPPPLAAAALNGQVCFEPAKVAAHFLQQWSQLWCRPGLEVECRPSVNLQHGDGAAEPNGLT
eukprot:4419342-Alexandrium_andersonii.AAC.1